MLLRMLRMLRMLCMLWDWIVVGVVICLRWLPIWLRLIRGRVGRVTEVLLNAFQTHVDEMVLRADLLRSLYECRLQGLTCCEWCMILRLLRKLAGSGLLRLLKLFERMNACR